MSERWAIPLAWVVPANLTKMLSLAEEMFPGWKCIARPVESVEEKDKTVELCLSEPRISQAALFPCGYSPLPMSSDCDHAGLDISPHFMFTSTKLVARCNKCWRWWHTDNKHEWVALDAAQDEMTAEERKASYSQSVRWVAEAEVNEEQSVDCGPTKEEFAEALGEHLRNAVSENGFVISKGYRICHECGNVVPEAEPCSWKECSSRPSATQPAKKKNYWEAPE